jgi:hypothetical protein
MKVAVAVILTAAAVLLAALLDLVKDELRGQLERIPYGLLRLASLRVPPDLREALHDREWLPELHHILAESERLPITCLIRGTRYALGLVRAARVVARELAPVRGPLPGETADSGARTCAKLAVGALAAAVSFVAGFGVFGAFGGAVVSLTGGLVVVVVVFDVTHDLRELGREREPTPWA